jgi:hypothetical protein
LQTLQKYLPRFGPFGISLNLVVAAAVFIEYPTTPICTLAVLSDQQRGNAGEAE